MYNFKDRFEDGTGADYLSSEHQFTRFKTSSPDNIITIKDLVQNLTTIMDYIPDNTKVIFDNGRTVKPINKDDFLIGYTRTKDSVESFVYLLDKSEREYYNFGEALEAVKSGKRISRKGWNGKGLFVVYQKGYPDGIPCNKQTAEAWGMQEGELFKCEPYLQINTTDGSHAMWVPSIRDCLAEDWMILE